MDKTAKEIEAQTCPRCGNWQRWAGPCENLCEEDGLPVQTLTTTYRIVEEK
jgi:hypothetical protein